MSRRNSLTGIVLIPALCVALCSGCGKTTAPSTSATSDKPVESSPAKSSSGGRIFAAIEKGDAAEVEKLVSSDPSVVSSTSNNQTTPMHAAVEVSNPKIVNLLLDKGADVNAVDADGQTPLHYAALIGNKDVIKALIARGADTSIKDKSGKTPAESAAESGASEIADLIKSGN